MIYCNSFHPYKGEDSGEDSTAAAIRANHPISQQCGLFYFEINIVDKGKNGYVIHSSLF